MSKTNSRSKKSKRKNKYKVKNWPEYNQTLKQRGSLTIWISREALKKWNYQGPARRGAQYKYSDLAIETLLTLKVVFHLQFRQVEGLMHSIVELMKLDLEIPDYTTLSRRQKRLQIQLPIRHRKEPIHLVIDSTGVKIFGDGEWKVRQHGYSKRRTWRKLHLAVDEATGEIQAAELTTNNIDDADEIKPLLSQTQNLIEAVSADGAYDKTKSYIALLNKAEQQKNSIQINIPPRKDAKIVRHGNSSEPPVARDQNLRLIRKHGRKRWKELSEYHRRSIAENVMFRYKTIIGPTLKARTLEAQRVEAIIGCTILNRMTVLGFPQSYKAQ